MNVATNNLARLNHSSDELSYDVYRIREDFPALRQRVRGNLLVYLDNAATSQKPQSVIDRILQYYTSENSNVHRGVHFLSELATREFERTRTRVQKFINAAEDREIVFVKGTTEAINLVAWTYARRNLKAGDEILISAMEHHSNIVPWQMICSETGAQLRVAPISDRGEMILEDFARLLSGRTRLVAITHVSNALGTLNPIKEIVRMSHECGIPVLVDGAQAVPHKQVDVRDLNCDYYAFSGHKVYGPTGIGVLYGKAQLLESMPPYQGGGDMISSVTFEETTYNKIPYKFEAGTPHIAGVIGLGAAIDYLTNTGIDRVAAHEEDLLEYATQALSAIPKLRLIGTAQQKASVLSFVLEGVHPHDVGTILDQEGIAVRTGHHCAQPVMDRFGIPATVRASFGMYNTREEIDALVTALYKVSEVFQ
ncbi:MAG TPA: cysteine desulfurase [Terriglobia bacterium]|nr:cysteine desulfurase [Terriglobia bacterium]